MRDKDKDIPGSQPTDAEAVRPAMQRPGPPRRYAVAPGGDDRTMFQPMPARRGGLRRPDAPPADVSNAPSAAGALLPRRAAEEAAEISVIHDNPLMRAAKPLLLLLGRLRAALVKCPAATIVPQITQAIARAETDMLAAGVAASIVESAKYCLCVAADEVLANLPGGDAPLAQGTVVRHFFGEKLKADRFLDVVADRANDDRDLLELEHACLAIAFVGASRVVGADATALQRLRGELYRRLKAAGAAAQQGLSPHWQGLALPAPGLGLRIPFWAITGVVGLLLFALYLLLRTWLGHEAETTAQALQALVPPPSFARSTALPPPTPMPPTPTQVTQLERMRKLLAEGIAAGDLSVEPTPNQIVIRIPDRVVFPPDRANIASSFVPISQRIALAIDHEPGPVKVIGYSDDKPVANSRYTSNFQLSLERAKSVAALLRRSLAEPGRVVAEGRGADAPLASNDTPDGRARNRRIEIAIARSD